MNKTAGVPEELDAVGRQLWNMAQRVAVQIAEKPPALREAAFAIGERAVRKLASEIRIPTEKVDEFVELQMKVIRQLVTEIDVGGSPQGGRAYAGHVGTGFDHAALKSIYEAMQPLRTSKKPFDQKVKDERAITWLTPKLVGEVKFTEWTSEAEMRHPVFLGLRTDKRARDVVREEAR